MIGRSLETPILKAGQATEFARLSAKWAQDGEVSLPHTGPLPQSQQCATLEVLQPPLHGASLSGSRGAERMNVLWYPWGQGRMAFTLLCPKTLRGTCPTLTVQAPTEGEGGSGCGMEVDRGWWDRGPISGGRGDCGRRAIWELKLQSLACAPLSRELNNTRSRAKLLRISRWRPQSIRPQVRALLKVGPVWTHWSQAHEADTESKPEKSVESGNNFFWTNQLEQMGGPKREGEKS